MSDEEKIMKMISLITGDRTRASIAVTLDKKRSASYNELKRTVERLERKEISDGKFNWHLKQLELNQVIMKTNTGYVLTNEGKNAVSIVRKAFKYYDKK